MVLAMAEVDHTNSSSVESSLRQLHMFSFGGLRLIKLLYLIGSKKAPKKMCAVH